jgi:hypothetical protein
MPEPLRHNREVGIELTQVKLMPQSGRNLNPPG